MCPQHFSKTLLIFSFTGPIYGSFLSLYPSALCCLSLNSKSPKPRIYSLGHTNLPQVRSCSDLGVIIDDKLTFSNHILSTTKKAYTQSAMMSRCFLSKNPSPSNTCFHILCPPHSRICFTSLVSSLYQRYRFLRESSTSFH